MTNYLCTMATELNTEALTNIPTCTVGGGHLEIISITDNPTVTDEFPNGTHLKVVSDIKARRGERMAFWESQFRYQYMRDWWPEGRP